MNQDETRTIPLLYGRDELSAAIERAVDFEQEYITTQRPAIKSQLTAQLRAIRLLAWRVKDETEILINIYK